MSKKGLSRAIEKIISSMKHPDTPGGVNSRSRYKMNNDGWDLNKNEFALQSHLIFISLRRRSMRIKQEDEL